MSGKGERAIAATFPPKEAGVLLPCLPNGVMHLEDDGAWDIRVAGQIVDTVAMQSGQTVAIEVELSRKSFERLNQRVLPSLLEQWYFCEEQARHAVHKARGEYVAQPTGSI